MRYPVDGGGRGEARHGGTIKRLGRDTRLTEGVDKGAVRDFRLTEEGAISVHAGRRGEARTSWARYPGRGEARTRIQLRRRGLRGLRTS